MRNALLTILFLFFWSLSTKAQCDSTSLNQAGRLLNSDTFFQLRQMALGDFDSCLWHMAQGDLSIPRNIPELFTVYAPDSSFALYSYRFRVHSALYSYRAILIRGNRAQLLKRDSIVSKTFNKSKIYTQNDWYGAVYYNLLAKKIAGKRYYFLFGYRDVDASESQKLIDVLWFDENGSLQLGAAKFDIPGFENARRFYFNYSKMGGAKLNYDPYQKLILKDHLIASVVNGKPVMLPDGSYEALEWKKKKWHYVEKVYDEVLEEAPRPAPLKRDNKDLFGNDEKK